MHIQRWSNVGPSSWTNAVPPDLATLIQRWLPTSVQRLQQTLDQRWTNVGPTFVFYLGVDFEVDT
jgi:hypothetical protein